MFLFEALLWPLGTGVGMLMVPNGEHSVVAFLICAFPSFF